MNQIKVVLKEKGITKTCLTKKVDKSYNTINEYFCNMVQICIDDFYRIAKILEVNPKVLLKDE